MWGLHKKTKMDFMKFVLREIDKCTPVRYNKPSLKEVPEMTVYADKSFFSNCCMRSAVAGTSMRIFDLLDTVTLAVSILVARLIGLLVRVG